MATYTAADHRTSSRARPSRLAPRGSHAGREGAPELWGQGYFALGDQADRGSQHVRDYYAFAGPFAEKVARGVLTTAEEVADYVAGYAEAGCHHLSLLPALADPDQVDLLAAVLERPAH